MLPKLLFSDSQGLSMVMLISPPDLYHLLAMGTAPWLLHCCSFGDRGGEFQRANGEQGVHAQSLLVWGMGPGR